MLLKREFGTLMAIKWEPAGGPTGSLSKKAAAPRPGGGRCGEQGERPAACAILCGGGGRRHFRLFAARVLLAPR